jgi:hypothetical protein
MDKIAVDSNILTYFMDVTLPNYDPLNDHEILRKEKISTLQIALYGKKIRLYILPQVEQEWRLISDNHKRFLHSMAKLVVFSNRPWNIDPTKLNHTIMPLAPRK